MSKKKQQDPEGQGQERHISFIPQDPPTHPQGYTHLPHAYAGSQPSGPSYDSQRFPIYNDPFSPEAIRAADSRAVKRFWSAFFYAVAIWVTLSIVFGSLGYDEMQSKHKKHHHAQTEHSRNAVDHLGSRYKPNDSSLLFELPPVQLEGEVEGLI